MGIEVGDTHKAEQYFQRSALVDLVDNQGNTEWGIHAASTGGTWMSTVFGFGGFRVKNGQMTFKPWLPENWTDLRFKLKWRDAIVSVTVKLKQISFRLEAEHEKREEIIVCGNNVLLTTANEVTVSY